MFDYVNYECDCPVCGNEVDGFQSKSGDCLLEVLEPAQVDFFYSSCAQCRSHLEFEAKPVPRTNFSRVITGFKDGKRKVLDEYTEDILINP